MRNEFPSQPILGVGAVIVHNGRVLIVKRANHPSQGQWSIPGGRVELGETLEAAVQREMREETGLEVRVGPLLEVFERVEREDNRIRYHFVILDYLCACIGGALCAGDDAEDVAWVTAEELPRYGVTDAAAAVIRRGLARHEAHEGHEGREGW
jgi:8-oxo-dGTP diphosphatase